MIDIKLLNKDELVDFINSNKFLELEFIPTTRHRALSQIKNPRLDAEDTMLLLAFEGDRLVGYLGVLSDIIFINNKFIKCGWLSCLWIDPKYRGKQIAQKLLHKSFEVWDKKLLITEFTFSAKMLYDKSGFFDDLQVKKGIRLYVRSDLNNLLPPKNKIFEKIPVVLKFIDATLNFILDVRFNLDHHEVNKTNINYVNTIDDEIEKFIANKQEKQLFKRGKNELNWIINNPWVLSAKQKSNENKKYYFSSSDTSFEFIAIKIKSNDNRLIGFMIFAKRNNALKLPYCYYEEGQINKIIEVINHHIVLWKIKTFTTFHTKIVSYLNNSQTAALFKRKVERHYMIAKDFNYQKPFEEIEIQDGDADCSFT